MESTDLWNVVVDVEVVVHVDVGGFILERQKRG
jgi:hypothetical protein